MANSTVDWQRFAAAIAPCQSFILTSHIRPDCDALGSELGMAAVLQAIGKQVRIVNAQATPPNLAFIDPRNQILVLGQTISAEEVLKSDAIIILDTSAWVQLGEMSDVIRQAKCRKFVVDHHVSQDDLGAEFFKDTTAEATGRLVVEAAEALQVSLTPEMSMPLFAAVATDTGWFRFGSATGGTYRAAGKLIDSGARPAAIYADLYEQDSLGRMKLRGVVLQRIVAELNGRLAHTYIRVSDFAQTNSIPSDTEDLVNMVLAVRGTDFAVIFVELHSGGVKVSFRSRCNLECNRLASNFGGGGHKAAAGATLNMSLEDAQQKVLDVVRSAMTE